MPCNNALRLLFLRAEHPGGNSRDRPARDQPHRFRAQPILESGNHRTFPCRERRKPHVSDLLGCFRRAPRVVALPRNLKKFRLRGTGTKRANADAVLPHLFRQALGKMQIKRLRRGIRRDVRHRLKRRRGSHDQDIPAAARNHSGQVEMRHSARPPSH